MSPPPRFLACYCDTTELPLPAGHRFPADKYRRLRERLRADERLSTRLDLCEGAAATDEQLLRVHTADYVRRVTQGELSRAEQREIGFPWSAGMVERSRRSTGCTIAAAHAAHRDSLGIHLAGGTHHAFPERGQGFCVFNDVAVAVRELQHAGLIRHALVIDLDVHQGNGTASIFRGDDQVFTFSMHGQRNFPHDKRGSDLDVALPDGADDETYLTALDKALGLLPLDAAEMVFYLAGADPFQHDRFGKLQLTAEGLQRRDQRVADAVQRAGKPVTLLMAGGYAPNVDDIVSIHAATIRTFVDAFAAIGPRDGGDV